MEILLRIKLARVFAWIFIIALISFQTSVLCQSNEREIAVTQTLVHDTVSDPTEIEYTNNSEIFDSNSTPSFNSFSATDFDKLQKPVQCKCGIKAVTPTGKIVGGTPISEGDSWPWFATLIRIDRPQVAHCGASLISSQYVLTAAHCLLPMIQVGLRNFKVALGSNDLADLGQNSLRASIEYVTIYPKFKQSYPYHYDIGVIKLTDAVNCTRQIHPVCLPEAYSQSEKPTFPSTNEVITAGFGKSSINGKYSQVLQQIDIKLVSNLDCRHNFSALSYKAPEIMENMLCAWGDGKDACVGDSGGPLIQKLYDNDITETNSFVQLGITSWGIGCANKIYPGIYTRVDKYLPWIKSIALDLE